MDWIHCNMCYVQPGDLPKRQFIVTSCGHIFCSFCENSGEETECKMCKTKCNTTRIYGQMAPDIQIFFEDPEEIMVKLEKVIDFQRGHRIRLSEYRKFVGMELRKAKTEVLRLREELKAIKRITAWNAHTMESRTPESQSAKVGPPSLPQYSLFSEANRTGSDNIYSNEQQFRTPTPHIGSSFSRYRYYPQDTTPENTPGSTPRSTPGSTPLSTPRTTPGTTPGTPSYLANSPGSVLYNPQGTTPGTPSYMGNSPGSVLSENLTGRRMTSQSQRMMAQSQTYHHSQSRSQYRRVTTPPILGLNFLSIGSQKCR